jgi:hypothetical protein
MPMQMHGDMFVGVPYHMVPIFDMPYAYFGALIGAPLAILLCGSRLAFFFSFLFYIY